MCCFTPPEKQGERKHKKQTVNWIQLPPKKTERQYSPQKIHHIPNSGGSSPWLFEFCGHSWCSQWRQAAYGSKLWLWRTWNFTCGPRGQVMAAIGPLSDPQPTPAKCNLQSFCPSHKYGPPNKILHVFFPMLQFRPKSMCCIWLDVFCFFGTKNHQTRDSTGIIWYNCMYIHLYIYTDLRYRLWQLNRNILHLLTTSYSIVNMFYHMLNVEPQVVLLHWYCHIEESWLGLRNMPIWSSFFLTQTSCLVENHLLVLEKLPVDSPSKQNQRLICHEIDSLW